MKYLVVLACILVATYAKVPLEIMKKVEYQIHNVADECKAEAGANDDDIASVIKHNLPTTDAGKCFVACLSKRIGFQDKSGKIDKEKTLKLVEQVKPFDSDLYEKMKKVLDTCLAELTDAGNECETAVNMFACIMKEKAAIGVTVIDLQL